MTRATPLPTLTFALASLIPLAACVDESSGATTVLAVRELGPTTMGTELMGREGGHSALVFSRSVWLFADTELAAADEQGSRRRGNSWSSTPDLFAFDGLTGFVTPSDGAGGPAEFFPYTSEELAFNQGSAEAQLQLQPLTLIDDWQRSRVLIFYAKDEVELEGEGEGEGSSGRIAVGSSLAAWVKLDQPPARPVLDAGGDEPTLLFRAPEPRFGDAAVILEDQLYAWGCPDRQVERPCYLARVGLDAVFDRQAWRFWTGSEWSPDLLAATPVFDGNTSLSIHWNFLLDRWLAIYAAPEGAQVLLRTAPAPTGPWSEAEPLFTAALGDDGSPPRAALGHAELATDGGRFEYVSYVRSTADGGSELRLVELELRERESE